jgi:hypothetical protein
MTESPTPARFVVLHHTGVAEPHFDLMIESAPGADLMTWRCGSWPIEAEAPAKRLKDHRRAYLDYEGVVSGGRGEVQRVAEGICRVQWSSPGDLLISLAAATLRLQQAEGDAWQIGTL